MELSGYCIVIIFLVVISMLLAGLLGMTAQRASLCSVRAVAEIMTTRRGFMLASFGKTAIWVFVITAGLTWIAGDAVLPVTAYHWSALAMAGGALFGVGAVINGGCAFSTLSRLASGRIVILFSLTGFSSGVVAHDVLSKWTSIPAVTNAEPLVDVAGPWGAILLAGALIWAMREVLRLSRSRSTGKKMGDRRLRKMPITLSTAAVWIGISNGILYAFVGPWAYTGTLGEQVQHLSGSSSGPGTLRWLLVASLFAGAVTAAARAGQFRIDGRIARWHGHFIGGLLMGFGASLVPGGNDVLILHSLPALSPHAIPTLAAMMVGIAGTMLIVRLMGRNLPEVDCRGDICRETQVDLPTRPFRLRSADTGDAVRRPC